MGKVIFLFKRRNVGHMIQVFQLKEYENRSMILFWQSILMSTFSRLFSNCWPDFDLIVCERDIGTVYWIRISDFFLTGWYEQEPLCMEWTLLMCSNYIWRYVKNQDLIQVSKKEIPKKEASFIFCLFENLIHPSS